MTQPGALFAPSWLLRPFQRFFRLEAASGILLVLAAIVALAWANSPAADSYFRLWQTTITIDIGVLVLSKALILWINDALMAIFFFVVGLEIKREVLVGELAAPKKAALSVAAALGGMLAPAAIYVAINAGGPGVSGWGIPMATDIAFALGVLALLGRRVPLALKIFVTAVAIVDDLGAVLVIALFYTDSVSGGALVAGGVCLAIAIVLNRSGVRATWPYAIVGAGLWLGVLKSGVHATVAGVLLAMTIPARRLIDAPEFMRRAEMLLGEFVKDLRGGHTEPTEGQRDAAHSLVVAAQELEAPLVRLEHALHPWVAFFIMPVFALANAGVTVGGGLAETMTSPVTLGIILGLCLGKPLGIVLLSWLAVRMGIAVLPAGTTWTRLVGVSLLCGIGFTMSLFIANLAFADAQLLGGAKVGILAGSLVAGIAGALVLLRAPVTPDADAPSVVRRGPESPSSLR